MRFIYTTLFILLVFVCQAQTEIYFETGKSTLTKQAKNILDSLISTIQAYDNIQLIGHTDTMGSELSNLTLSEKRVISVKNYLNKSGKSITTETSFKGETKPKYDINSKNRRVEISHLKRKKETIEIDNVDSEKETIEENEIATLTVEQFLEKDQINLKNIQFKPGTANFYNKAAIDELKQLRSILSELGTLKIVIEGHVCCVNDLTLSTLRAKKVYWYLLDNGISKERISYVGFSNTRPLLPETSAYNNQQNRRVEVRILER